MSNHIMIIDLTILKLIFALSVFAIIMLAGWYPFKKRLQQEKNFDFPVGETLATGVFLGAGLLHMLPEANVMFHALGYQYPFAYIITGSVFLLFLWLEHIGKELYHHEHASHPAFAILAWLMLSFHSIVLAAALGFSHDYALVGMLFIAIIAHKWAESFAIAMQLNKSSLSTIQAGLLFILFALMSPLGVYLGWNMGHNMTTHTLFDPTLVAVSAGTFLYLGTLHGLERCVMVQRCCNLRDFSYVIVGFLIMAAVAAYV